MASRVLFFFLVLVLCSSSALAAVLIVPDDYDTIATAAAVAVDGDIIEIAAGTYGEHDIDLATGVLVRGATGDRSDVVLDVMSQGSLFRITGSSMRFTLESVTVLNSAGDAGALTSDLDDGVVAVTIRNCRFDGCSTTGQGGVVSSPPGWAVADLVFEHSVFENCSADGGGAVACVMVANYNFQFTGVTISNCIGRALVFVGEGDGTITGSRFVNNIGGVVQMGGHAPGTLLVTNSEFVENTTNGKGGAIYATLYVTCDIDQSRLIGNSAVQGGGAIYGHESYVSIKNSLLQDNTTLADGGAIHTYMYGVKLEMTTLKHNRATRGGGVTVSSYACLSCTNVDFDGNTATEAGGAAYAPYVRALQTTWSDNSAEVGGALYLSSEFTDSRIDHGLFDGNTATTGASVFCAGMMLLTLNCCEFDLAECAGGPCEGVIVPDFSDVVITADGCVTPVEPTSWGGLKAMFR